MSPDRDSSDSAGRPDPTELSTAAEFVDAMRRLKLWTGWGYRRLEKRAVAAGDALPRSTLTVALSRATLPREDLVAAFTRACGCDEDQIARWVAARRRIAGAADPPPQPAVAAPPAEARRRPQAAWLLRAAVILAVLAAAVTTTGILLRQDGPPTPGPGEGQGQAAPGHPDQDRFRPDSPTPDTSVTPTSTTPPDSPQPPTPTPDPILQITLPVPDPPSTGLPLPGIPTRPTVTLPGPTTPTTPTPPNRVTHRLPDGRTIYCPLPYLVTHFGPLAQCTLPSGNQVAVVHYSPVVGNISVARDNLEIVEPTWYDGPTTATDGIIATARGYAIVKTRYGPGIWATQYRHGEGRIGIVNPTTNRFYPNSETWLPVT